jgi:hypothetical protein
VAFEVPAGELPAAWIGLSRLENLDRLVITMPHKEAVIPLLDALGPAAQRTGTVNTARRRLGGGWEGEMFDGEGFRDGLERARHPVCGTAILQVGCGATRRHRPCVGPRRRWPTGVARHGTEPRRHAGAGAVRSVRRAIRCRSPPRGAVMRNRGVVYAAAFSPDGSRPLIALSDGTARLWNVGWPQGPIIAVACTLLPDRDVGELAERYGIVIRDPIRGSAMPRPAPAASAPPPARPTCCSAMSWTARAGAAT